MNVVRLYLNVGLSFQFVPQQYIIMDSSEIHYLSSIETLEVHSSDFSKRRVVNLIPSWDMCEVGTTV